MASQAEIRRVQLIYETVFNDKGTQQALSTYNRAAGQIRQLERQFASSQVQMNRSGSSFAQLGAQVNDFAVQVGNGSDPIRAFSNQIGQLGFAMSGLGGVLGKAGNFLLSGWGSAITAVIAIGAPFLYQLFQQKEAIEDLNEAAFSTDKAYQAARIATMSLTEAQKTLNDILNIGVATQEEIAALALARTARLLGEAAATRELAKAELQLALARAQQDASQASTSALPGLGIAVPQSVEASRTVAALQKQIDALNADIENGIQTLNYGIPRLVKQVEDKQREEAERLAKQRDKLKKTKDDIKRDVVEIGQLYKKLDELAPFSDGGGFPSIGESERLLGSLSERIGAFNPTELAASINPVLSQLQKMGTYLGRTQLAAIEVWAEMSDAAQTAAFDVAGFSNQITQSFTGMIDGTRSVKEAFRDMVAFILNELAKLAISKFITSFLGAKDGAAFSEGGQQAAAHGAVFANGTAKFAYGGIVNRPTNFAFSRGGVPSLGLMGEAGPEAILPLSRGRDGKLGVKAANGMSVTINNYAGVGVETTETEQGLTIDIVRKVVASDIARGGSLLSSTMERTYGIGRSTR